MSGREGLSPATRLVAVAVTGALFFDATARSYAEPGLSTFGRPPELAALWATLGVLSVLLLGGARERILCARRLTMVLLLATFFDGAALRAAPELVLALTGVTLAIAGPLLRVGPAGLAALLALACAVPGLLRSDAPQGGLDWATAALPVAALAVLLPSLFPGRHARRPALVVAAGVAVLSLAALSGYLALARGLDLPLGALTATRLRLMGAHPNLGVPQLLLALLVAAALAWTPGETRRAWARGSALAVLAALLAVQSRTGFLAAAVAFALLVARRLPFRAARFVQPVAAAAIAVGILLPVVGVGSGSITHASRDTASKAVSFRASMWELGRDTLAAAPWQGHGPAGFRYQARHARPSRYDGLPKVDHPHNVVLAVGGAFGWPGLFGLAALFAATCLRRRDASLLADGASAAALAVWATHALDLGGSTSTLYPAVVLVALGLRDATARPDDEPAPRAAVGVPVALLGIAVLVAGGCGFTGRVLVERAAAGLAADAGDGAPDDIAPEDLDLAARLRPFDPEVPYVASRLAERAGDAAAQLERLREASRRDPTSPRLLREEAVVRARLDPDDPEVLPLLDVAASLDPRGPRSWRAHAELALVLGARGREEDALTALVDALVLRPEAITRAGWDRRGDRVVLGLGGERSTSLPLARVLLALARERADRGEGDPATATRLALREVEILTALGEFDRAEAACERLFADDDLYRHTRLATVAIARGDPARVLREIDAMPARFFASRVWGMTALSETEDLDVEAFERLAAEVEAELPDVVFEAGTLREVLRARLRVAERTARADEALRHADALAYASR